MSISTASSIRLLSVAGFQGMNSDIYLTVNDRNYNTADMVTRLHRYSTHLLKAVRREKVDMIPYHLSMAFSWLMALANRLHIAVEDETWKRYPNSCPYCVSEVCVCKERPNERGIPKVNADKEPATMEEYQRMFERIYPANTLQSAVWHLNEEIGELDEALEHYRGTHQKGLFGDIVEELADVFANICAVATCSKINLASEMADIFSNGCPKCFSWQCRCGFVIAKAPTIR